MKEEFYSIDTSSMPIEEIKEENLNPVGEDLSPTDQSSPPCESTLGSKQLATGRGRRPEGIIANGYKMSPVENRLISL